ncbi:hypothetical protein K470DRAFT_294485 [Piedraia hortae CBS 480.64]|uniref:Uncharacterized protein n=1 Tax=Piedraia hortae CBS 480.64 TaxID=1314780 RepID=A0A6A7C0W8_9PEZI|nr:hypothetical protein K470DRAFT_294485 [Piedraia hortae CBS 480.64]
MSITYDDFVHAAEQWRDAWLLSDAHGEWLDVQLMIEQGATFLRIVKCESHPTVGSPEQDEDDPEAISQPVPYSTVIYDIIHSPLYEVPVLYYYPTQGSFNAEIPGTSTMTDHPLTQLPVHYIHPCRAAEMMGEGDALCPAKYLLRWMGVFGVVAGLSVPMSFAQTVMIG